MHWLHSAGRAAIATFPRDGPMSFGYSALMQSLALIRKVPAAGDVLGCSADHWRVHLFMFSSCNQRAGLAADTASQ